MSAAHLQQLGQAAAEDELRTLPGIGPFYSQLISMRGSGLDDALPLAEAKAREVAGELDGIDVSSDHDYLAERWRPVRAWATVLIRATAERSVTAS